VLHSHLPWPDFACWKHPRRHPRLRLPAGIRSSDAEERAVGVRPVLATTCDCEVGGCAASRYAGPGRLRLLARPCCAGRRQRAAECAAAAHSRRSTGFDVWAERMSPAMPPRRRSRATTVMGAWTFLRPAGS